MNTKDDGYIDPLSNRGLGREIQKQQQEIVEHKHTIESYKNTVKDLESRNFMLNEALEQDGRKPVSTDGFAPLSYEDDDVWSVHDENVHLNEVVKYLERKLKETT